MIDDLLARILAIIQEDVGQRGLLTDPVSNLVTACPDDFSRACRSLAESKNPAIGIITGFFIPTAEPPAAETDGPLGALFLARALVPFGFRVVLATDHFAAGALQAGLSAAGLADRVRLIILPPPYNSICSHAESYWRVFAEQAGPLTHLLAIERVGPSHTLESLQKQSGTLGETYLAFLHEVPPDHQDRCHTMRGRDISPITSPAHFLLEGASRQGIVTIGIGDGGNELGMGKIPWEVIHRNIPGGGLVACRVPTDHLIVCGLSNWGAYALAVGTLLCRGLRPPGELFDVQAECQLLKAMVQAGPLVDGVTGKPTLTVDGLGFDRYSRPLREFAELIS